MLSLEVGRGSSGNMGMLRPHARELGLTLGLDSGFISRSATNNNNNNISTCRREDQAEMMAMHLGPNRPFPVQLDLLPRGPLVQHTQPNNSSCISHHTRQTLFVNPRPAAAAAAAAAADCEVVAAETHSSSRGGSPRGGLDMNEIPVEETDVVSSPRSCSISPPNTAAFAFDISRKGESSSVNIKRERERVSSDAEADRANCEVSSRGSDEEDGAPRKKLRLSKDQSALLEESFKEHSTLNPKQKNALAKQLNLRPRQVEVWFQNRRARTKLKQTEIDCELLKRCCETLTEENRRLQKELQELRAIKVPPPCVISQDFYMPLPAATLTMCPSCERLAAVDSRSGHTFTTSASAVAAAAKSHHQVGPPTFAAHFTPAACQS